MVIEVPNEMEEETTKNEIVSRTPQEWRKLIEQQLLSAGDGGDGDSNNIGDMGGAFEDHELVPNALKPFMNMPVETLESLRS